MRVGAAEYVDEPVRRGDHSGNHFKIVLRDCIVVPPSGCKDIVLGPPSSSSSSSSTTVAGPSGKANLGKIVQAAVRRLQESGFPNYFGLQRFGTMSSQTHKIGRAILQESWREAFMLILSSVVEKHTLEPFRTMADARRIKSGLPPWASAEGMMLEN